MGARFNTDMRATMRATRLLAICATLSLVVAQSITQCQAGREATLQHPDLPLDHPRLARAADRIVEQIHITGGHPDEVTLTWVTNVSMPSGVVLVAVCDEILSPGCDLPLAFEGLPSSYSMLVDASRQPDATAYAPCAGSGNYTDAPCYYTSGLIHSAQLTGLLPDHVYHYRISGDTRARAFKTAPAVGAESITFAVVADLGQTANSTETVDSMYAELDQIDSILFAGDLSYADGYAPRWDSYARLGENLWSAVPTSYVGGNHEVGTGMENWQSYEQRYPFNFRRSGSSSMLWASFEAGPAHVVQLCSYCAFGQSSLQYEWLANDLANVDRARTPWLVVMFHTPWYTSNAHHSMKEGAQMREAMEGLMRQYKVDIVFNGHVHAYERTYPISQNHTDCASGIPFITIGDGGNREMFAVPWGGQPEWSALREYAYGHGKFSIVNATHAHWEWLRNPDAWNPQPGQVVGDELWLVHTDGATTSCTQHMYMR